MPIAKLGTELSAQFTRLIYTKCTIFYILVKAFVQKTSVSVFTFHVSLYPRVSLVKKVYIKCIQKFLKQLT